MTFRRSHSRYLFLPPSNKSVMLMVFLTSQLYHWHSLFLPISKPRTSATSKLIFVGATKVTWHENDMVSSDHEAAHNAPRSQKYWDEHGIERPDYAMTDAELIAKRRRQQQDKNNAHDDERGVVGRRLLGMACALLIATVLALLAIRTYANVTGDWDTILKNPVGSVVANRIRWLVERAGGVGVSGHRLGSASTITASTSKGMSDEDSRRLARLARFDHPKNMLDDMKTD